LNVSEVGLDPETKEQKSDAPVTFLNIYEGQTFTLGIFIIRKGNSLPLHDHPGMFGVWYELYFTKLLNNLVTYSYYFWKILFCTQIQFLH